MVKKKAFMAAIIIKGHFSMKTVTIELLDCASVHAHHVLELDTDHSRANCAWVSCGATHNWP